MPIRILLPSPLVPFSPMRSHFSGKANIQSLASIPGAEMVGVGEMLASAVVKEALRLLLSLIHASMGGPVMRIQNFQEDLRESVKALKLVEAAISDAEKRSVIDEVMRLWLKDLKKAAYEIYDMFDDFQHGIEPEKLQTTTTWHQVLLSSKMANKMKIMKKTLKKISERRKDYGNEGHICEFHDGKENDKLETTSRLGSDMIVGRRMEKESVISILLSSHNIACTNDMASGTQETSSYTVIHGLAGVGKTELAKLVFNDERIKEAFPQRAWVYLHKSFGINDIGNAIIGEVEGGVCRFDNKQAINKHLEKVLSGTCLIVLDNLWDSNHLTGLQDILGKNASILVTSRRAIPLDMVNTVSFCLEPLSDKLSIELVNQVAFSYFTRGDGIPETAMNEIVAKCRGVPLAIKSVASSLLSHGGGSDELLRIIKARLPPMSQYGAMGIEETVVESLKLTYHLMTRHLKLCFAYCAIFPKGCQIDWKDLYHQWTAFGLLIPGSKETDRMRLAENNVCQLLDMSFLQDAEPSSVTKRSTRVPSKLKMHDLVHDLAMCVADDDLVVISPQDSKCTFDRPRYARLVDCDNMNLLNDLPTHLRALHIVGSPLLKSKWYNSRFAKFIRVLDISGTYIEKLPSSIRKLKQVRYLNASRTQSKEVPEAIGRLFELRYLNFHESNISKLPESTSKLGRLMHLDLSACMSLQMLPRLFCDLKSLSLLNLQNCSLLSSLPDDLGRLKNLEYLNLSGCTCLEKLPESLGELESLRQLDLSGCKKLFRLPNSCCLLTNLTDLNLARCSDLDIPVDALNKLIKLEYANMSSCPKLFGLPQEFCSLKHLTTLNLSGCSNLNSLPERLGQMKSLRFVSLDGCAESVRKRVLQHGLGAGLQSLPAFVIETKIHSIQSNISGLEHEKFSELELYRLEKVRTVDEAGTLKLSTRSELRSLGLMWTLNINRFINDETLLHMLEPPVHLQKLTVQGYMGERFPKWSVEIGCCQRAQLDEVRLMHFPMINSLPYLGALANLKNLHLSRMPKIRSLGCELWGHTTSLKKLEIFTLEYMENLVEWSTTLTSTSSQEKHEGFVFPALQELNIFHCPQLTMQPCPPRRIKWEVRASNKPTQLLLQKDEVMQSLTEYMGLMCPFDYTTELHVTGYCRSSPSTAGRWKFHGSLIALNDLTCDNCSWIDKLIGNGSSMQCVLNLEISGFEDTKGMKLLQEQVDMIAYSTRSSLAKSWPDWFSKPISIDNGVSPHFLLTGYASCRFRGWIDEITSFLGNLIRINMEDLPLCDCLPPLGHLPKLQELRLKGLPKIRRIDRDFCKCKLSTSGSFFPRLTKFVLNDMRNLEEWTTKVPIIAENHFEQEEFMFPGLLNLTIWNCPMLKLKPCPPRALEWDINNSDNIISSSYDTNTTDELATTLQVFLTNTPPNRWILLDYLPRIKNLAIVSCHGIESLPDTIRSLSCLQSLTISKCNGLKHLPEWLGELASLEMLMVISCPMEFLPGGLQRLSFLHSLSLSCCDKLVALPGCFGDLNSLKKLTIEGCSTLKSLPPLSMLEHLVLKCNGDLEKWCETPVNKTKFDKIKRQKFWLESTRGNNYMLPARFLAILWSHDDRYWRPTSIPVSRYAVSMQLLEVWWLVIEGSIPVEALSTNTSYEVYLVYKLAKEHDGLRWGDSYVHVDGLHTDAAIVSFVDEDAVRVDHVSYPVCRSEGWMELRLGMFCNNFNDNREVKVGVTERTDTYAKKGLIIEGMEIRQSATR